MKRFVALALLLCPPVAWAAGLDGSTADDPGSQLVMTPITAEAPIYTPPQLEHLLDDLGGVRSDLESHGIYLSLSATAQFAGNVSGGVKQGATSANQIAFQLGDRGADARNDPRGKLQQSCVSRRGFPPRVSVCIPACASRLPRLAETR